MPPEPRKDSDSTKLVLPQTRLVTDIVSSTALKQLLGDKAGAALIQQHHALVRELIVRFTGTEEAGSGMCRFRANQSALSVRLALLLQIEPSRDPISSLRASSSSS